MNGTARPWLMACACSARARAATVSCRSLSPRPRRSRSTPRCSAPRPWIRARPGWSWAFRAAGSRVLGFVAVALRHRDARILDVAGVGLAALAQRELRSAGVADYPLMAARVTEPGRGSLHGQLP